MPPVIDYEKCIACHKCVELCTEDVFFSDKKQAKSKKEKPVVSYPEACFHCNLCVEECPVPGALRLKIPLIMNVPHR
jgi:adenylylsulfate reductase, subunit B